MGKVSFQTTKRQFDKSRSFFFGIKKLFSIFFTGTEKQYSRYSRYSRGVNIGKKGIFTHYEY
jgi:hypothetical protein